MPNLTITRQVVNATVFTANQNDLQLTDVETFVNTTKLDSTNIQNGGIATANYAGGSVDTTALAANSVTTAKITDANVTTAKIADSNVTTAKIADGNVTAAKIETNVNLVGTTVKVNSKFPVVSNTNTTAALSMIRGSVTAATGALLAGEGFSSSRGSTGNYTLTWTTAFSDTPIIVTKTVGGDSHAHATAVSTTGASIEVVNYLGGVVDADINFSFIVVGQRT